MKPAVAVLRIGDRVMWRGGFGNHNAQPARVTAMERCEPGEKYGDAVEEMPWSEVPMRAVVDLDNGHWAYGEQLTKLA